MRQLWQQVRSDFRELEALRREHGSPVLSIVRPLREALAGGWPGLVLFALFMTIAFIMETR